MAVKVNHVWFGDDPLGALEKFNVYSWRALGHEVTIYAHRWDGRLHDVDSLGLSDSGVQVRNLSDVLAEDDRQRPKTLPLTRGVLKGWIETTKEKPSSRDRTYNLVDLTKSYIGGTCQGIVLDFKVGPSPHLAAYEDVFGRSFVSYTRGGNTAERPENQCIGTMQQADTLRTGYAEAFDNVVKANLDGPGGLPARPDGKWFDLITGWHGRGFAAAKPNIDVATQAPEGKAVGDQYKVPEIGQPSHGPFRVFKAAGDQTNKSNEFKTKPEDVAVLCQEVWDKELKNNRGADQTFLAEVEKALQELHGRQASAVVSVCSRCGKPVKSTAVALKVHEQECTGKK